MLKDGASRALQARIVLDPFACFDVRFGEEAWMAGLTMLMMAIDLSRSWPDRVIPCLKG